MRICQFDTHCHQIIEKKALIKYSTNKIFRAKNKNKNGLQTLKKQKDAFTLTKKTN